MMPTMSSRAESLNTCEVGICGNSGSIGPGSLSLEVICVGLRGLVSRLLTLGFVFVLSTLGTEGGPTERAFSTASLRYVLLDILSQFLVKSLSIGIDRHLL